MTTFLPNCPERFEYYKRCGAYDSPDAMRRSRAAYRRIYQREYKRYVRQENTTLYPTFSKVEMRLLLQEAQKRNCSTSLLVREIVLNFLET